MYGDPSEIFLYGYWSFKGYSSFGGGPRRDTCVQVFEIIKLIEEKQNTSFIRIDKIYLQFDLYSVFITCKYMTY